ncbi:MAG: CinA family nicotinamide mononucleotide deamidase-related protein [Holophaga sp.]|nr:CinA family nicotinamide mononucleotide deamidase-related protein [Holophaga sp.]
MPRIECIAVGSEMLTAGRLDTNSVWLADRLGELGLAFHRKTAVGDSREDLRQLFREALDRSDVILCTGGLGPTFDDFTKDVWAEVVGVPLLEHAQARAEMLAYYAARNRVPSASNFQQIFIPEGAERVPNPAGTAPGVYWENPKGFPGRRIILFPGVPREMKLMWEQQVAPRLRPLAGAPAHTLRMVFGSVPESGLGERTQGLREQYRQVEWTILAGLHHVELVGRCQDQAVLAAALADFQRTMGQDLAHVGTEGGIEDALVALLSRRQETLAVAESMTGGNLAARLTAIPGVSARFLGGATVYSARAKAVLAGLDPDFIKAHGTVSEPVTAALATAIRERLGTTWGLAVTGNAGPTEDQDGPAPVGTCLVAVAGPDGTECKAFRLPGGRAELQARGASWALDLLRRKLLC